MARVRRLSSSADEYLQSAVAPAAGARTPRFGRIAHAIAAAGVVALGLIQQPQLALALSDDAAIGSLTERAEAEWRAGKHAQAIDSLQRAVLAVRRAAGLYDERQRDLLLQLVDWRSDTGDLEGAADALQYLERLAADDAPGSARGEALTVIAEWRCRIGRFDEGRRTYRSALDVLGPRAESEKLRRALLAAPGCCLYELAASGIAATPGVFAQYRGVIDRSPRVATSSPAFRFHALRFLRTEAERALVRAVQEAERAQAPEERLAVLLLAGDWFQMKDHTRAARRYYQRAESIARTFGSDHALSTPVLLFYPRPSLTSRSLNEPNAAARVVEVEITVRSDGRSDGERVVNRQAGKTAVDETLLALHVARFRPRMIDGRPIETQGVRHREVFFDRRD